ncbi:MAG: hypothetical protein VX679_04660 [Pseudomonadota bacterium]|nr:hypothetical protein [Pseudomonadota bacterium]
MRQDRREKKGDYKGDEKNGPWTSSEWDGNITKTVTHRSCELIN